MSLIARSSCTPTKFWECGINGHVQHIYVRALTLCIYCHLDRRALELIAGFAKAT